MERRYSRRDVPLPSRRAVEPRSSVRLTVLGSGPAAPQPDTPASGILVQSGSTTVLLDCGQGVASRLVRHIEPDRLAAVIVGHMHADHFIDLSALRYRFPWGGRSEIRVPVLLPPGGMARLGALPAVVSERDGFFDDAFAVGEYDPSAVDLIGELEVGFVGGRHYVPAWGVALTGPDGCRIVYSGDTGPNPGLVAAAQDADLLVCEATLGTAAEDDPEVRGHLTLDEALEHGAAARARRVLITHYPSDRRAAMQTRIEQDGGLVTLARPDMVIDVSAGDGTGSGRARVGSGRARSRPAVGDDRRLTPVDTPGAPG
jgi:ribonuclease BN (tRNA processing enzyme)